MDTGSLKGICLYFSCLDNFDEIFRGIKYPASAGLLYFAAYYEMRCGKKIQTVNNAKKNKKNRNNLGWYFAKAYAIMCSIDK